MVSNAARFYHEYFQNDKPELLHRINRATKSIEAVPPDQVEVMQAEIMELRQRLASLSEEMDTKIRNLTQSLEVDHQHRVLRLETTMHEVVSSLLLKDRLLPQRTLSSFLPTAALASSLHMGHSLLGVSHHPTPANIPITRTEIPSEGHAGGDDASK